MQDRLNVATKTEETVCIQKHSTSTTDTRSFSGLCNVYRRSLLKVSRKAAPLNELLRKGQPTKFDLVKEGKAVVEGPRNILINRRYLHCAWRTLRLLSRPTHATNKLVGSPCSPNRSKRILDQSDTGQGR